MRGGKEAAPNKRCQGHLEKKHRWPTRGRGYRMRIENELKPKKWPYGKEKGRGLPHP